MTELDSFLEKIKGIAKEKELSVESARSIVKELNEFLFTTHDDIGKVIELGKEYNYFSDFHKYWKKYYKEILDLKIDEQQCIEVAKVLHDIYSKTQGKVFMELDDTYGLNNQDICRVRFLTANQDFRGSRDFVSLAKIFVDDPSIYDINNIFNEPDQFVKNIGITNLSQNDKRVSYAKNIAKFLLDKNLNSPYELLDYYGKNIILLKNDLINYQGAGYGNKKTDMFLRDMIVLGVWKDAIGFDSINVASDVNTIKVALRTGILRSAVPLLSSFLDIFGVQYAYVDDMNAKAWRKVWECWRSIYPNEVIQSPCLLDYFIYNVIGRTFCKENLVQYECEKYQHTFFWHTSRNKTCQICFANNEKNNAFVIGKMLPCDSDNAIAFIKNTDFYKSNVCEPNIDNCPFKNICNKYDKKYLQPPKSISIEGATGWSSAYTKNNCGGGGLMS